MTIFNSLGSNYDFGFAIRSLFVSNRKAHRDNLIRVLEEKYGGEVYLTYKGREAIRLALRAIALQRELGEKERRDVVVGICGFTCYAVYEAVKREGYELIYLDIDESLNFSYETLVRERGKNPRMKILIVQNTLGNACGMKNILRFCREKGIVLIEDLAHSVGAKYDDGKEAGSVGDFTVLSFSQDKMVDGVSGGALITQNSKPKTQNLNIEYKNFKFEKLPLKQQVRDRFYPMFTWKIRKLYGLGIGKMFHFVLKRLHLLSMPMGYGGKDDVYGLPDWYCGLINHQFKQLNDDIEHRKKISSVYEGVLNKSILCNINTSLSSNLRFPILIENRKGLIDFLKINNIFVSDIWYDAPVAPERFLKLTDYDGQCPNSEKISQKILNLPTHRNVSEKGAIRISQLINQWLEKNK